MEIKVTDEKDNPLLERKELDIQVVYEGATPKREELRNALIAMLNSNKELLILDSLKVKFGAQELTAEARIYKKKEKVLEVEPEYMIARNFPVAGAKKEKPAEKKEKPGKEKKEAPKAEEKKEEPMKEAPKAEDVKPEKKTEEKEKPPEAKKTEEPKPKEEEKVEAPAKDEGEQK